MSGCKAENHRVHFQCDYFSDKLNFCALWKPNLKSHLSTGWCLRLTPRPPCAECALTQSAQKKRALWVKPHYARGGRGVNRKHHSAERCDLRFGCASCYFNFFRALWKIFCTLWKPNLKSHLFAGWCLRLTPRPGPARPVPPRAECALTQSAQ